MRGQPILVIAVGSLLVMPVAFGAAKHHGLQGSRDLIGKAPFFSATTSDGKTYDLKTLTKKGPVYLLFIKKDCPVTANAIGFYNSLYKAYGEKAPIVGVLNGESSEFKAYTAEHHLPFPTVLDPTQKIVSSYKVENSPWMVEVKADGTVGRTWKGYSQDFLQEMNKAVAKAAGATLAKIDFSDAPKDARYG